MASAIWKLIQEARRARARRALKEAREERERQEKLKPRLVVDNAAEPTSQLGEAAWVKP